MKKCVLCLPLFIAWAADAGESLGQNMVKRELIASGRGLFVDNCSGCHGMNADGKGPAAPMLSPKPRDLVNGSFKFRSTPTGSLPTIEDLVRTIDQGVPGTSMPSFRLLSQTGKVALAAYIQSLRPEFSDPKLAAPALPLSSPPPEIFGAKSALLKAATRGQKTYAQVCITCHGAEGLGDGVAAASLTDSDGHPLRAANLSQPMIKSGRTVRDIYKALSTGLDGTPMPGFASAFDEPTRWDLVAYVMFLRGRAAGIYQERTPSDGR